MSIATKNIFIVGAKRTALGAKGGKLKDISTTELSVIASKAAIAEAKVNPSFIGHSIIGNAVSDLEGPYLARHVGLKAGLPVSAPALTINRLCGSGMDAVCMGAEYIALGNSEIVLTGGSENMSRIPFLISGLTRFGVGMGKSIEAIDVLSALTDTYTKVSMGMTAEILGEKYGITREDCDNYALRSQLAYQHALANNVFEREICPVEVKGKKGIEVFCVDEIPRKETTLAGLQKLKPVFKKDGMLTVGTAAGICDAAASVVVAGETAVKTHNLSPLSRVVAWHRAGCDPLIMGIAPVEAVRGVLKVTGLCLNDIDLFEVNEVFASQYLACEKELGLDRSKSNLNGGSIALGHPFGASGARIITHLTHELIRRKKRYGIAAISVGGGQGMAVLLENMQL